MLTCWFQVSSVALIDQGLSIIIDSSIGLIRLRLEGKDLDNSNFATEKQPQIYEYIGKKLRVQTLNRMFLYETY